MKKFRPKYCLILLLLQFFIPDVIGITANFTFTKASNCAPTIVRFTNNSTSGSGITYTWDFGLGATVTTSDSSPREQIYSTPGTYTVRLTASSNTESATYSQIVIIYKGPSANFNADPQYGCSPLAVSFISTSSKGDSEITGTIWDFRNGDTGTGSSYTYTYTSPGTYDLILKVTDKNGCTSLLESEKLITVAERPEIEFTASDTFACSPPLNVSFTNLSTGSSDLTYFWDFGNGKSSNEISNSSAYTSTGSYDVMLKATDKYGCSDSLVKKSYIKIGYTPGVISVYDMQGNLMENSFLCDGTYRFVYSDSDLPDYEWIVTDNTTTTSYTGNDTLTYTVEGAGTLTMKLVYGKKSYCTSSITVTFVKSLIDAGFTVDNSSFCSLPATITLTNSSLNSNIFKWYLSGNLISGDRNTAYTITENDLPAETWEQIYSHLLNRVVLPVKLISSNEGVCFDSVTKNITIAKPLARFMPDKVSGCIPFQVVLSDSSHSESGIDSYTYIIGNEIVTSATGDVRYTFTKAGVYDVKEIIKSGNCYDTSEVIRIYAGDKLVPEFTVIPGEVCNGGSIRLTGNTADNSLVNMWRFKSPDLFDLSFHSVPDTTFSVYSDATGYKNISLEVNYNGCISATTKNNILYIKGSAGSFTESFSCDSSLVYKFKSGITPATSLSWTVSNTVAGNSDSLVYRFPSAGNYSVKLTATDNSSGCVLTKIKTVKVRQLNAAFTLSDTTACAGDTIHIDASSSVGYINNCYNEGFLYNFGDDSPPVRTYLATWDHVYTGRGTDTLKVIVTADNGCIDTARKVISIFKPIGSFSADKTTGCVPGMSINFRNTSTDTTIVSWIWNFGDKTTDSTNTVNVTHNYSDTQQKTYYPTLTVYDAHQCSSSYSMSAILSSVNSDFQANDNAICLGQSVTFTPSDPALTNLFWNFGDGSTSSSSSTHTYNTAGEFTVSLTATKDGCTGTVTKEKYIRVEKANAEFLASASVLTCYPDTLSFVHDNSVDSPAYDYLWQFDTYTLTDRTSDSVSYVFYKPGNHVASLTVTTLNGCKASSSKNISISGPTASVTFGPKEICYNDAVTFTVGEVQNASQWRLLFGDGSTSTENPATHRYTFRGKVVPAIELTSGSCNAVLYLDTLYVSELKADFNSPDSSLYVCYGNTLDLINNSLGSTSWSWSVDNIPKSTDFDLTGISLNTTGEYNVRLVARDDLGCLDTLVKKYTVVTNPDFVISGDTILCSGDKSVNLSVAAQTGWTIKWSPSSWLSGTSAFSVTASPVKTQTYTAVVTNIYGCSESRLKTIYVNEPPDISRIPLADTTIYIGEQIQLIINTSATDMYYTWSPDNNISCTHCNDPWVSPTGTITYIVEASNSCYDTKEEFLIEVIKDFYLEAPSAFTPNGDSNNDLFRFEGKNIAGFELKIFNRWGEMVYSSNDINQGWDGNVNGHPQNIDSYVYMVNAETIHGYRFIKKGEFLLLK